MIPNRCSMRHRLGGRGAGSGAGNCLTPVALLPASLFTLIFPLLTVSCGPSVKISRLADSGEFATLALPPEERNFLPEPDTALVSSWGDTLKVTGLDGKEMLIMRAVKDEETGEMVATDRLDAAIVTARFRNVAERNGRIRLEFQVTVPEYMRDSEWQLRLHPLMTVLDEEFMLDDILITGSGYRKSQLRGYEQYRRFLSRIVTDSLDLVDMRSLDIFIKRNIPELYAFRTDSSYVPDETFHSSFGVTSREALEHYTIGMLVKRNNRLMGLMDKKRRKYIKSPIVTEGIRLDTIMSGERGELIYNYVQTIGTSPGLRKVDICLEGEIYGESGKLYGVPRSAPLTFYVSSLASFTDGSEKYMTKIISRNVEDKVSAYIDFASGSAVIDEGLGSNAKEMSVIRARFRDLLTDTTLGLDSIVIAAYASPEGSFRSNLELTHARAKSVAGYFSDYIAHVADSLRKSSGLRMTLSEGKAETTPADYGSFPDIAFISRSGGENWVLLDRLVSADTLLSEGEKEHYRSLSSTLDHDIREASMRRAGYYGHLFESHYPKLRLVEFSFHLYRKNMVKDTVHTTVLDTTYMRGVDMLKNHRYEDALELLLPYHDFNTAVAFTALDRNFSAIEILRDCPKTAKVNYLMAILYSRQGREREAVECFLHSCEQDPSFRHRANLDPEIAMLINDYKLNEIL